MQPNKDKETALMSARAMYSASIMCMLLAVAPDIQGTGNMVSFTCAIGLFLLAIFEERANARE